MRHISAQHLAELAASDLTRAQSSLKGIDLRTMRGDLREKVKDARAQVETALENCYGILETAQPESKAS